MTPDLMQQVTRLTGDLQGMRLMRIRSRTTGLLLATRLPGSTQPWGASELKLAPDDLEAVAHPL